MGSHVESVPQEKREEINELLRSPAPLCKRTAGLSLFIIRTAYPEQDNMGSVAE